MRDKKWETMHTEQRLESYCNRICPPDKCIVLFHSNHLLYLSLWSQQKHLVQDFGNYSSHLLIDHIREHSHRDPRKMAVQG